SGAPLRDILAEMVALIEDVAPDAIASILLLDEDGAHVRHGAAPGLPDEYNRAIDGEPVGPAAGSGGTAAVVRQAGRVVASVADPRWERSRELARRHGLRACSSFPILSTDGRVLGTFAVYYREPRIPDDGLREMIGRATHVAGIAIERRQLDEQQRALSARSEAIREEERTGIAREIHDELGQALTALKLDIAWVARRVHDEAVSGKLGDMSRAADDLLAVVRRISAELRPGILDSLGLVAAIEWQAE